MSEVKRPGDMGIAGALRDLAKKYQSQESGVLGLLRQKEQRRREVLEGAHTEFREIPAEEIENLRFVQGEINRFIAAYGKEKSLDVLNAFERRLDALSFWRSKFTTGDYGRNGKLEIDVVHDSLYYMTPSGASLRIKKAVLQDPVAREAGTDCLKHAVQPIADLVVFQRSGDQFHFERDPREGFVVREYFSTSFCEALEANDSRPFSSPLELYIDDTGIRDVGCLPELRAGTHDGHYVNKIFFTR